MEKLWIENNFIAEYVNESDNLSIFKDDNPYLIRVILKKNTNILNTLNSIITPIHIENQIKLKKYFDESLEVFEQNNIKYLMAYGNLLGLIRHGSVFIPWDDDFDIMMPPDSLNKLLGMFRSSEKYYLRNNVDFLYFLFLKKEYSGLDEDVKITDIFTSDFYNGEYCLTDEIFDEYFLIKNYRVPIKYNYIFHKFYDWSDVFNDVYIYNHMFNDRWETNKHKLVKLRINEANFLIKKIGYEYL